MKVYYLGPDGSYSHILTLQAFDKNSELIGCSTFTEVLDHVITEAHCVGVLPIENSTTSSVHENIDHIFNNDVQIIGEASLKIMLNLVGLESSSVKQIKAVYSHPKAIAQSTNFLHQNQIKSEAVDSTSAGAELILEKQDPSIGTIGSANLAKKNGLKILESNIGNEKENYTRFIFVSKSAKIESESKNKLSYIYKVKHQPGSLAKLLSALAELKVNLVKIESRPIPGTEWEYSFWVDLEQNGANLASLNKTFEANTLSYKLIGRYAKGQVYES